MNSSFDVVLTEQEIGLWRSNLRMERARADSGMFVKTKISGGLGAMDQIMTRFSSRGFGIHERQPNGVTAASRRLAMKYHIEIAERGLPTADLVAAFEISLEGSGQRWQAAVTVGPRQYAELAGPADHGDCYPWVAIEAPSPGGVGLLFRSINAFVDHVLPPPSPRPAGPRPTEFVKAAHRYVAGVSLDQLSCEMKVSAARLRRVFAGYKIEFSRPGTLLDKTRFETTELDYLSTRAQNGLRCTSLGRSGNLLAEYRNDKAAFMRTVRRVRTVGAGTAQEIQDFLEIWDAGKIDSRGLER